LPLHSAIKDLCNAVSEQDMILKRILTNGSFGSDNVLAALETTVDAGGT